MDYLSPCIPELKIKDYETYEAFRCGICSQLREEYGYFLHLGLATRLILFALLADGLAGREATMCRGKCPLHHKRCRAIMCHTQGIRLAARLDVITSYHIYQDAPVFSPFARLKKALRLRLFCDCFRKAAAQSPAIERLLVQQRAQQQALELAHNKNYEEAWKPLGNTMGAFLVSCAPDESAVKALRRTGYAMGKLLFLCNSIDTYARDQRHGIYNIYLENGLAYEKALENAKYQCGLAAEEMASAYNLLNMKFYRTLVDNIIFQGLEECVQHLGERSWHKVTKWEKV